MRAVGPDGIVREVAREWFRRPDWLRDAPDPGDDILEEAGDRLSWAGWFTDGWWGTVLLPFGAVIVALVFFVPLPLVLAVAGLLAGIAVRGIAAQLERGDEWPLVDRRPPAVREDEAHAAGTLLARRA